jgi:hypothetical protein
MHATKIGFILWVTHDFNFRKPILTNVNNIFKFFIAITTKTDTFASLLKAISIRLNSIKRKQQQLFYRD